MKKLIDKINKELSRLNCDTDANPYSGLMIEATDDLQVKVYDDYESDVYSPLHLLEILKTLKSASLETDKSNNIWTLILPK